ncbi:MAG: xanthine dehydrogenase family protein subunit M [Deltaproteobacteria bacterium]|nr:xanthine dehydrogenase family protein subunit M [Deltaproteobacteria bacterium]
MIPETFEYAAPRSLKEAIELLARTADAKLLGGGMSLIPALKHRLAAASLLVDLGRVPDLEGISEKRGKLAIGGRTTHRALTNLREFADVHVICETAGSIGDVQVRHRGTIGGSLVHADPAADWPAAFLALDGEATVVGPKGERAIPAAQFFTGMLASAVRHDEVLTEVRLSVERKRAGTAYVKLRQPASGFAIVGVAAQVTLDRGGRIERASVGVTGVNSVPFRAAALEKRLAGKTPDAATLRPVCARIEEADPMEDLHASADYRAHLVGVFALRALLAASARAAA